MTFVLFDFCRHEPLLGDTKHDFCRLPWCTPSRRSVAVQRGIRRVECQSRNKWKNSLLENDPVFYRNLTFPLLYIGVKSRLSSLPRCFLCILMHSERLSGVVDRNPMVYYSLYSEFSHYTWQWLQSLRLTDLTTTDATGLWDDSLD